MDEIVIKNKKEHQNEEGELDSLNNNNDLNVNNLNKKYAKNNDKNSKENIELDIRLSTNQRKNSLSKNKNSNQLKKNNAHKMDKLLDFNLKFESNQLERAYNKSYLAVTRLVFLKYLFFLIIFSILWIVYLSVNLNNHTSSVINTPNKIENYVFLNENQKLYIDGEYENKSLIVMNDLKLETQTIGPNSLGYLVNRIIKDKNLKNNKSNVFIISYLSVVTIIFLLIFAFVLLIEIKETRYRRLEKDIQKNELEKKVDTKKAERDLKLAMEEIINKDEENVEFKKKLKSKYKNVTRLRNLYSKLAYAISIIVVILIYLLCFLPFFFDESSLNFISHFIWFCIATLLIYLIYPFQLLISLAVGLIMSILFEVFSIKKQINENKLNELVTENMTFNSVYLNSQISIFILIKILLHTSLHLIACYLKLSLQGIKRETFLKVAHIHKAHMTAQQDKDITERMIKSIMPPLFTHVFGKPEEFKKSVNCVHQMRPLFIYPVNEVSILFADIVGFTRMSSTKTAEQLVRLLNDLYGRFDKLCEEAGCEKISTLGDCYYCVSGCLNGRKDHAKCCVEMGLLMVKEIELFNKAHNVDVNMRVGVHTGNALCGFIGGKRFRFDVWSGDVTLANKMESSGRAGWVHISEDTYKHLDGKYNTELGEKYSGKSTYFVIRETKRETVADAMKQFASYDGENILNTNGDDSNNHIKKDEHNTNNERELLTKSQDELINSYENNKDNLLLMAVKDIQFFKPDFNFFTMRFGKDQENKYQSYLISSNDNTKSKVSSTVTSYWTKSENSFFLSILISFIINLLVSTSYFLSFVVSSMSSFEYKLTSSYRQNFILIITLYCTIILIQSIFLIFSLIKCNKQTNKKDSNKDENNSDLNQTMLKTNLENRNSYGYSVGFKSVNNRKNIRKKFIKIFLINLISIIILSLVPLFILITSLPVISNILTNSLSFLVSVDNLINKFIIEKLNTTSSISDFIYINDGSKKINLFSIYAFMTYIIALIHFGSFIQLSSLFKTFACFLLASFYSLTALFGIFDDKINQYKNHNLMQQINSTYILRNQYNELNDSKNLTDNKILELNAKGFPLTKIVQKTFDFYSYLFIKEHISDNIFIILDSFLMVLLIWILNRQVELIQRLSFKHDQDAHLRVVYAREQKELASWLIDVVLPAHVVDHVKEKKQYSRNYNCVGVLFVSLCNFWEFFEESYEGGRELLRVLNEITVDFDRLFDDPKYKNVEKIKSIGSTIMIASGLNPDESVNDNNGIKHLYDLIDFALELNEKLEAFNNEAMSVCHFKFQMRMGFNCGPVTAGVIGTERLLYDIWGDTVNVASRMDSTGQPGFLQTPKEVVDMLKDSYKFFERGTVQIKGKDQMVTYFLNPKENKKTNI